MPKTVLHGAFRCEELRGARYPRPVIQLDVSPGIAASFAEALDALVSGDLTGITLLHSQNRGLRLRVVLRKDAVVEMSVDSNGAFAAPMFVANLSQLDLIGGLFRDALALGGDWRHLDLTCTTPDGEPRDVTVRCRKSLEPPV